MQRSIAHLPLHGGRAPAYLFKRMARMSGLITMATVHEYGPEEMLRRLSDPAWFQAFGCVLGFDWHSSGVTTVTCGALKEAQKIYGRELGICVAGGKGGTSRKAPLEIATTADRQGIASGDRLVYASKLSAKVDSAAVQDGYQLYHHSFFFTSSGAWCVVQQGMNKHSNYARRYHWLGESVDDFVCEPHLAIEDLAHKVLHLPVLNLVARSSSTNRALSAQLVRELPTDLLRVLRRCKEGPTLFAPEHHPVLPQDVNLPRLEKVIRAAHERHPASFEELLGTPLVGPATIRSVALIAEIIYDAPISKTDPAQKFATDQKKWADYSYAHGGKDGTPFPVNKGLYDKNIQMLTEALRKAKLGQTEKIDALRRLSKLSS